MASGFARRLLFHEQQLSHTLKPDLPIGTVIISGNKDNQLTTGIHMLACYDVYWFMGFARVIDED